MPVRVSVGQSDGKTNMPSDMHQIDRHGPWGDGLRDESEAEVIGKSSDVIH